MTYASLRALNLTCEYAANPLGLQAWPPRLSWRLEAEARAAIQTAYQIVAGGDPARLAGNAGAWWDTGRVPSNESLFRPYGGPPLASGQRCYWKVRVWDGQGLASPWSEIAFWEMGLLAETDWQARWIEPGLPEDLSAPSPVPLLRATFQLDGEVKSARAYVTSRGLYELALNGARVSDWLFRPGWTSYRQRLQYQTYDVTAGLKPGLNAVGAMLGDGWYRGYIGSKFERNFFGDKLALLAQINITYADGRRQVFGTGPEWKAATGPILVADHYMGEDYDARLERTGWTEAGYDDADWPPVQVAAYGFENLVAQDGPPVRRQELIRPVALWRSPSGTQLVDLGQNFTGWMRLRVRGPAGTAVTLRHAEMLDASGELYTANLNTARQTDRYVLKGGSEEVFEPRFTFHGFRYMAVEGYPGELTADDLTGIVVHSDMSRAGWFECSHPLINQLQRNLTWSQKSNFLELPTDCPQRDERVGYTGDVQIFLRTGAFNYDLAGLMVRWLKDVSADQTPAGVVPHMVPDVSDDKGSAGWGDAAVIVPWTLYLCYGDRGVLAQQYASASAWVDYLRQKAGERLILRGDGQYGDWLAIQTPDSRWPNPVTNTDFIATAYFAHSTALLQKTAQVLGKTAAAADLADLFDRIKAAFNQEFVTPAGRVGADTQTSYVLALAFDLLPEHLATQAAARLAADIGRRGNQLTTGFLGSAPLLHVLSRYGYLDLAYALLERTAYPSWLYPITRGATTIWERWDGQRPDGTFQDHTMNSFNHYAYGAVGDWLYRVAAGIEIDPSAPGYQRIIVHPRPGGSLTHARAEHDSPYGRVAVNWSRAPGAFLLSAVLPANTEGLIHLPAKDVLQVTESGLPLDQAAGLRDCDAAGDHLVVRLGSGRYYFRINTGLA